MPVCGEMSNTDIIAKLKEINQIEDNFSEKEEDKKMQGKPLPITPEFMMHMHELRRFFES